MAPYTWNQTLITLPAGMSFDTVNGILSGTPTASGAAFTITLSVTDSSTPGPQTTATRAFPFVIHATAPSQGNLTVMTTRLPDAVAGSAYLFGGNPVTLDATGGQSPYTWAVDVIGNQLPGTLTLAANGTISGTPGVPDEGQYTISVTVTDSTGGTPLVAHANVKLVIGPPTAALSVTTSSLPGGTVNTPYTSTQLVATGGEPPYSWEFVGTSNVPFGLDLTPSGTLYGIPRQNGTYIVNFRVWDSGSPRRQTLSSAITLTIAQAAAGFQMTTTSLAGPFAVNSPIIPHIQLQTNGVGGPVLQWIADTSSLTKVNLALDFTTGQLSGTPTASGVLNFPVGAVNSATPPVSAVAMVSLTIPPPAYGITTTVLPDIIWNQPYLAVITVQGGTGPFTWSDVNNSLPNGITITGTGATATISGTPNGGGGSHGGILFQCVDNGAGAATAVALVQIGSSSSLPGLSGFQMGFQPYDTPLIFQQGGGATLVRGTAVPAGFILNTNNNSDLLQSTMAPGQSLPGGLAMDSARRLITGTPTAAGRYFLGFTMTDSSGQNGGNGQGSPLLIVSESFGTLEILEPASGFRVSNHTLPGGREQVAYPKTSILADGVAAATTLTYSLLSGSLPPGITLDPSGFLSGTPTAAGLYSFVVQIVGASTIQAYYELPIDPALPFGISRGRLSDGVVGMPYSETLYASGGVPSNWSDAGSAVTFASLGLSLNTGTGLITGTPSAASAGHKVIKVTATSGGNHSVRFLAIDIAPTPITADFFANEAIVGTVYSDSVKAFGGTAPYTFALAVGSTLPPGLSISASGALSGTSIAGTSFGDTHLVITDATARQGVGRISMASLFRPSPTLGFAFTGGGGSNAQVNKPYSQTPTVSGGVGPYTFSKEATIPPATLNDALPGGISLTSTALGTLSGTPTESGEFIYVQKVTDTTPLTADMVTVINVQPDFNTPGSVGVETRQVPNGSAAAAYPTTYLKSSTNGGGGPLSWSAPGPLPAGLVLDPSGFVSTPTPPAQGTYYFVVTVTDTISLKSGTGRVKLVVGP